MDKWKLLSTYPNSKLEDLGYSILLSWNGMKTLGVEMWLGNGLITPFHYTHENKGSSPGDQFGDYRERTSGKTEKEALDNLVAFTVAEKMGIIDE